MDGYHYWSYQGATNTDPNGLGINYGTSPVECATSNDSGCFWGDTNYTHILIDQAEPCLHPLIHTNQAI